MCVFVDEQRRRLAIESAALDWEQTCSKPVRVHVAFGDGPGKYILRPEGSCSLKDGQRLKLSRLPDDAEEDIGLFAK